MQDDKRTLEGRRPKRHPSHRSVLLWVFACMPMQGLGHASWDSLIGCTRLEVDTERLACFDREMTGIQKTGPQPPASVSPTPEQQFGLSSTQVLGPTPTRLHARIVRVSRSADRQVFVLDNTQIWQQIELDPDFAARMGQEATISKGALGSFWLTIDSHRATRVRRITSSK
jgi:hypothetical protein